MIVINPNDPADVQRKLDHIAVVTARLTAEHEAAIIDAESRAAARELELARLSEETGLSIAVLERLAAL